MKILVLSDLHLEFANLPPPTSEVDVVVLAGDIWKNDHGIHWARATWPNTEIIYVAGNHEYYRGERNAVLQSLRSAANDTGVNFLDNDEVIIGDVRFLGATLWTDFKLFGPEKKKEAINTGFYGINDFMVINEGMNKFTPEESIRLFDESSAWLSSKLDEKFEGKTVVVTHHLPSWRSVAPQYKEDMLSACFASNLDRLLGRSELWIHGHTHTNFDYLAEDTRVICNPRGYVQHGHAENAEFNAELVIEI